MKFWIARDPDGELNIFTEKPQLYHYLYEDGFDGENKSPINLDLFPELTFENSPQEVELKLVNKL